jgi:hypothetical protein
LAGFLSINTGNLQAIGEQTIILGGAAQWNAAENRRGIIEVTSVRPYPVLALSSERNGAEQSDLMTPPRRAIQGSLDLALSFDEGRTDLFRDETGHYAVSVSQAVTAMGPRWARVGLGAAYFQAGNLTNSAVSNGLADGPVVVIPQRQDALFSEGQSFKDFSVEFWLYPMNMENGEQILSWSSSHEALSGKRVSSRIQCAASRNRLQWTFSDFFTAPGNGARISVSLTGLSPIIPRSWSHHLIRFDSTTGLLEYLVNGSLECVRYATASGREGAEVYNPLVGEGNSLILGGRYTGFIDEFRVYGRFVENPELRKYPNQEGRVETRAIDLGEGQSSVLRIEALGGRASIRGGAIVNEYGGAGKYRFADDSALQFFIRTGDSPYRWTDADWRPFEPGVDFSNPIEARYVQLAAVFYPSGDGETTPYLEELRIVYRAHELPRPPSLVIAVARDGAVDLSWRGSPDPDATGYRVYYGVSKGEYFGSEAIEGASPIDAGNRASIRISGLRNGVLYYFAVAAYDLSASSRIGEFSREVSARPLRTTGE